jgi:transcription elongation factor Elf1
MFSITCPECNTETNLSLDDSLYQGPFRCWKCRALFRVVIQNSELKAYERMSEDELEEEIDS